MRYVYGRRDLSPRHIPEKKKKKSNKKQMYLVLPAFPVKVDLGNNYPLLNVYNVVPRVRRINRTNEQTCANGLSKSMLRC